MNRYLVIVFDGFKEYVYKDLFGKSTYDVLEVARLTHCKKYNLDSDEDGLTFKAFPMAS